MRWAFATQDNSKKSYFVYIPGNMSSETTVIQSKNLAAEKPSDKYQRGGVQKKGRRARDKRLEAGLRRIDQQYKDAVKAAAGTDMLLQEEVGVLEADGMEKTYQYKQDQIKAAVDVSTANKRFDLALPHGPYTLNYSRNGRGLLLGGGKGHVASMDWRTGKLECELQLGETVHAVQYLHNDQFFAVAQQKYTYIYDRTGVEVHRLNQHTDCTRLAFLPYHFLLVTAGRSGMLKYHDVSTGEMVSEFKTKLGPTRALKQNPWNAVMHLGHGNGTVSLWLPSMPTPLAKIQACRGPVTDIAVDREGKYMVVLGSDKRVKVWDLRKMAEMDTYMSPTPASSLDISDTGMVVSTWGPHATIWKDMFRTRQTAPYMTHLMPGTRLERAQFVPFEDILGVGHLKGFASLIVPGSGEANFDALELNPYELAKQRQELEVRLLLNKLAPDTIALDPNVIGQVDKRASSIRLKAGQIQEVAAGEKKEGETEPGIRPEVAPKNSKLRSHLRKRSQNVIDQRKVRLERNLRMEQEARATARMEAQGTPVEEDPLAGALKRFD